MSNPGVLCLAKIEDLPYRFEIEDNIGEAIHVHYKDIRLDMTIREFEHFAQQMENILDGLYGGVGFRCADFEEVFLNDLAKLLPEIEEIRTDTVTLEDMRVDTFDREGNRCYSQLKESRVMKALQGDPKENDARRQTNLYETGKSTRVTNSRRVNDNLEYLKKNGYPNENGLITLNGDDNTILDGQHRAACLLLLNGNQKVPVRRLLFRKQFSDGWLDAESPWYNGTIYYATEASKMSEDNRIDVLWTPGKTYRFDLPEGVTVLRFDPVEYGACVLRIIKAICDRGELKFEAEGYHFGDGFVLAGIDPHISFQLDGITPKWIELNADLEVLNEELLKSILLSAEQQEKMLREKERELTILRPALAELNERYNATDAALGITQEWLRKRDAELAELNERFAATDLALSKTQEWLRERDAALTELNERYAATDAALSETQGWLQERDAALTELNEQYTEKNVALTDTREALNTTTHTLEETSRKLQIRNAEYDAVVNSLSWKLTKPFRAIAQWFAALFGKRNVETRC